MAFEELHKRVSTAASEYPATIRLRKSAAKTCCYVTLRAHVVADLGWQKTSKLSVAIGTGEDAGKMRLIARKDGAFFLRVTKLRGHGITDIGHVAEFGAQDTKKIGVEARKIDKDTLEIDLPHFADHIDDGSEEVDEEHPVAPVRSALVKEDPKPIHVPLRPTAAAQPPKQNLPAGVTAVEHSGVRVTGGAKPMILHAGERLDLTPRQARILGMLTKVLGSLLPTAALIQKVGLNASAGAAQISDDYFALKDPLSDLGLRLTFTPKMGYTLAKV